MTTATIDAPRTLDPTDWQVRNRRLDVLLASVPRIVDKAVSKHITSAGRALAARVVCFSGGNDSIVLAHLMWRLGLVDYFAHANTGIGVEATRQFVRDTCTSWGVPLLERHPPAGSTYEDRVMTLGFPGPADHGRTFNRIKGRALEQINKELVGNPYRQRVLFIAGRRFTESERRRQRKIPVWERSTSIKSMVWCSPLRGWTALDLMTYRHRYRDCPRNPVADELEMSGECTCGCNAKRGELDYLDSFPSSKPVVEYVRGLQQRVTAVAAERGIPAERCRWGWGAYRVRSRTGDDDPGALCASDCGLRRFTWDDTQTENEAPRPTTVPIQAVPIPPAGNSIGLSYPATPVDRRRDRRMTHPEPPEGAAILDRLHAALTRYVILPSPEAIDAAVLWIAATHAQPAWTYAARLVIKAPEKRCGKSRFLDIVDGISYRPLMTVNASTPAIYRSIGTDDPPTILLDEADTIFGGKQAEANEDLRGLLNAGHQRGRPTIRWNQQKQQVEQIQTFAMAALAGIGSMPDTIEDRAVVIKMRRRTATEKVAPFRARRDGPRLKEIAADLNAWLRGNMIDLEQAVPDMPLEDRAADTWEPLIAVADLAGGNWPGRARSAALALNAAREGDVEYSDRLRLLIDCRTVFADLEAIPSTVLLDRLKALPEAPWAEFNNTGLTAMKLGVLLREYEISSENITFPPPTGRAKGFPRAAFTDSWQRYCPPEDDPVTEPYKPYKPYADPQTPSSDNVRLFEPRTAKPYTTPPGQTSP